jgi:hypothetical protein
VIATEIMIAPDGTVRVIYSDALAPALNALGSVTIARASHVEPDAAGQWVADMAPVGGPKLAPCALRSEALAAEVAYLIDAGTPVPASS